LRVQGLGFGVWGSGFGVRGLGLKISCFVFRVALNPQPESLNPKENYAGSRPDFRNLNDTSGIVGGAIFTAKVAKKVPVVSFRYRAKMANVVKSQSHFCGPTFKTVSQKYH
jgi:hypothetical protein